MIVLGVLLLIVGFVAKIAIVWTLGIVVLVVGAVLAIAGTTGRQIGGRRHYYWPPNAIRPWSQASLRAEPRCARSAGQAR